MIVQHLPPGFTASLAAALDRECRIDVKEARSGDTGAGEDGAAGITEMERAGAVTLAQDPTTCVAPGMPQSAIRGRSI